MKKQICSIVAGFLKPLPAVAVLALAGLSQSASADTIYYANDTFTDSTATNSATISNTQATGTGNLRSLQDTPSQYTYWYTTTLDGFGDGNVIRTANFGNLYRAFNDGATLKLSDLAVNDKLSFSFDMRCTVAIPSDACFGFVNYTPGNTGQSPLFAFVNFNATNGIGSDISYRDNSQQMGNTGNTKHLIDYPGVMTAVTTEANTNYHLELAITKIDTEEYSIVCSLNGVEVVSATSALTSLLGTGYSSIADSTINGVGWRFPDGTMSSGTTYLDNIQISLMSVPEPATWAMLVGGMGMLALGRRMARRLKA